MRAVGPTGFDLLGPCTDAAHRVSCHPLLEPPRGHATHAAGDTPRAPPDAPFTDTYLSLSVSQSLVAGPGDTVCCITPLSTPMSRRRDSSRSALISRRDTADTVHREILTTTCTQTYNRRGTGTPRDAAITSARVKYHQPMLSIVISAFSQYRGTGTGLP